MTYVVLNILTVAIVGIIIISDDRPIVNNNLEKAGDRMNQEIKTAIKAAGVKQWQVAKACGISEFTLVRWLRDELTDERRKAIFSAIEALSREGV